jgi:kynurenine formamidase
MPDPPSSPLQRLTSLASTLNPLSSNTTTAGPSIPFDPNASTFPTLSSLPSQPGAPPHAAWVWGPSDNLGRLNLLTPSRVLAASRECIRTGETARLDLPLNIPAQPAFGRCKFEHRIKAIHEGMAYDDEYTLNTQSGTQWDGFRHVAHMQTGTGVFYNGGSSGDFRGEKGDDEEGPSGRGKGQDNLKNSTHWWSEGRGMSGRAVLLDYRRWAKGEGRKYQTSVSHAITLGELKEVGRKQGIDIRPQAQGGDVRPGDILMIRTGWTEDYYGRSEEENAKLALREGEAQKLVGVEQSQEMIEWLHDCWFAAVGGDQPAFERWPTPEKYLLHEYLLGLWGVPIGEMLDLERAGEMCEKLGRWTFFVTSAPARCEGGVGSHVNGTAIW